MPTTATKKELYRAVIAGTKRESLAVEAYLFCHTDATLKP